MKLLVKIGAIFLNNVSICEIFLFVNDVSVFLLAKLFEHLVPLIVV